ncbi:MAG TPA: ABC transporter permease [Gemmatimonadaceae bacterium]|nr:ABC transporter permease [Gemmatimonadaceae bacterium]
MPHVPAWRRYLRFWRPDVDADVDDELRFHFETRIEELVVRGMSPDVARAQALEEFGDVSATREGLRAIDRRMLQHRSRTQWWATLGQEVRFTVRRLLRQPGFTIPAILTLAVGLGATVAAFTVLHAVVLRALPYPDAGRLVKLDSPEPKVGPDSYVNLRKAELFYFRQNAHTLDALALYELDGATIRSRRGGNGGAELVITAATSANLLSLLGGRVLLGRPMTVADSRARASSDVWLTHDFWARYFGGDSAVVGQTMLANGTPVTIAGVFADGVPLPEEVSGAASGVALWTPLHLDPAEPPGPHFGYIAIGRLRPGASLSASQAELTRLTARLPEIDRNYAAYIVAHDGLTTRVRTLHAAVLGHIGPILWMLFGAVLIVLVIACVNVTNLMLARLETRRREMAVRAALGASRSHLARYFFAETILITLVSGVCALALAGAAVRAFIALAPGGIPRLGSVHLGWAAVVFTMLVSLVAGLAFGLVPLVRRDPHAALLAEAGRRSTASRRQHATRGALVITQVAFSLVLLAGAALLARSFRRLSQVQPGFEPRGVLTFDIILPEANYKSGAATAAFYRQFSSRVAALPGVQHVGATTNMPLVRGGSSCSSVVRLLDRPRSAPDAQPCAKVAGVTPGFFRTMGIPVRGKTPTWDDLQSSATVAVVSESFARRYWPGQNAVGKMMQSYGIPPYRVIGVVGDVHAEGLNEPTAPALYLPILPVSPSMGGPAHALTFAVRGTPDAPAQLLPAIRRTLSAMDPQVVLANPLTMRAAVARSMSRTTFTLFLLALASGIALLLSAIGIYGVISYLVARRRNEIGIRMALGARTAQVGRLVVWQSVRLAAVGVVLGLIGAVLSTRFLRSLLFGVSPTDPATLAAVSLFLLLLVALASYLPARRAMRIDPVEALRHE